MINGNTPLVGVRVIFSNALLKMYIKNQLIEESSAVKLKEFLWRRDEICSADVILNDKTWHCLLVCFIALRLDEK